MTKEKHGGNIYKYSHRVLDFSANLNPLGMAEEVKQAIIENIDKYEDYPDVENRELEKAMEKSCGIPKDRIVFGNGGADMIFRVCLALRPKKSMIVSPTFSEYEKALHTAEASVKHFFLKEEENFQLTKAFLKTIDESLDLIFICNPNNPTGLPIKRELMLEIAEKCREKEVVLVVDQCFSSFLRKEENFSIEGDIERFPNVIIIKAFTKIYAMAGLRLGYGIFGSIEFAEAVRNCLQPWAVSTVASKAGVAALSLMGYKEKTREYVTRNRTLLMEGLKELGYKVFPSETNYLMFKGDSRIKKRLEEKHILVRDCSNFISLGEEFMRIAVRREEENLEFLKALRQVTESLERS